MPAVRKLKWGEGVIEKRGQDRYGRMRYRGKVVIDGKRINTPTTTDRSQVYEDLERLVDPSEPYPGEGVTLGEWLAEWLAEIAPAGDGVERTDANRRWAIDKLAPLHEVELADLTTVRIERHLRMLATGKNGLSKSSLVRVRAVLGQALDAAINRRLMSGQYGNPARGAVVPRKARESEPRRTLTTRQVGRLLAAADSDPLGIAVVLMVWLGLRPGEATGLEWSAIDLNAGTLDVVQFRRVTDSGEVSYAPPKSGSDRRMTFPPEVLRALRKHATAQKRLEVKAKTWTDTGLVVTTEHGTAVDPANLRRTVRALAKKAGIKWEPELRPYELRHTAASLLIESGYPLEEVADLLGNDVRTLIKHYRHRSKRVVDLRAGMSEVFGGGR